MVVVTWRCLYLWLQTCEEGMVGAVAHLAPEP